MMPTSDFRCNYRSEETTIYFKKNKTNQNPIPLYSKYISKHFEEKGFTSCERQSVMAESLSVYDEENSCKHFIYK